MSDLKHVTLRWSGEDLVFEAGGAFGGSVTIDGNGGQGPSPMDALLLALAGCMAADIRTILEKSRVPLDGLEVSVGGERAAEPPRRYTRIEMVFRLSGPGHEDAAKVERAVALSRETYCSVMHTLRQDVEIDIRVE